ncbi:MAG: hypothetical protein AAF735_03355 [Myxococcota bacterium]
MCRIVALATTLVLLSAASAYAAKRIPVCGTQRESNATLLSCAAFKTNASLKAIADFKSLKKLVLDGRTTAQNFKDSSAKKLASMKEVGERVTWLEMGRNKKVTPAGWSELLASFPNLKVFKGTQTVIDDSVLPTLAKMTQLEEIWLSDSKVTCSGFKAFAGHDKLKTIRIENIPECTDADASVFIAIPNLKLLMVRGTDFSEAGVEAINEELETRVGI